MNFLEVRSTNYMIIDNNLFHPHLCLQCNRQQKPDQIKHITITMVTQHIPTMTKSHHGGEMSVMMKVGMCLSKTHHTS